MYIRKENINIRIIKKDSANLFIYPRFIPPSRYKICNNNSKTY